MHLLTLLGVLLGLAGALGVLTGLVLVLSSRSRHKATDWLQTDFGAGLNTLYFIERPVYRHHRKAGATLIAAAALWMWLLWRLDRLNGLVLVGWLLSLCAIVIGLFLIIRPSALKPFERGANRWIEPFARHTDGPVVSRFAMLVLSRPRITGILLLIAGIACLYGAARLASV